MKGSKKVKNHQLKLAIIGPQGSGKSTQSRLIAKRMGLCLVETGQLIRSEVKENSEIGRKLKEALENGKLADSKIVAALVKGRLASKECSLGFIMDGYPRRFADIKNLDPDFDLVFYFEISDKETARRLLKRGRKDDTPELIARRLKIFHARTEPLKEYYLKQGKLAVIKADRPTRQVSAEIFKSLDGVKR